VALTQQAAFQGFAAHAPELFEEFCKLAQELQESSEVTESLAKEVTRLAERIPDTGDGLADTDPFLRLSLLTGVVHAQAAAAERDRPRLVVAVERARQALRDIVDEDPIWRGGPVAALRFLLDEVQLPRTQVQELLDVGASTLRRWLETDQVPPPAAERVAVVAKIVNHLRHALTARGVVMWLNEPHPDLDDRSPIDELKDVRSYQRLVYLAAGARSAGAS